MRSKVECNDCGTKNYTVEPYCVECSSDLTEQSTEGVSSYTHKLLLSIFTL